MLRLVRGLKHSIRSENSYLRVKESKKSCGKSYEQ